MYIGGIYGASVGTGTALPVYVDTDGHLGTSLVNARGRKLRILPPRGAQPQVKLDEFQKQQKRIAELETTVSRLVAIVKDQAAQIEKVSAKLELRKPAQRVVANKSLPYWRGELLRARGRPLDVAELRPPRPSIHC
jgi:hypothetical protein